MASGSQTYFHLCEVRDYETRSRKKAITNHIITQNESDLIEQYISEKIAVDQIGKQRVMKINTTLLGWRHSFLSKEFSEITMQDVYSALLKFGKTPCQTGKPLSQNTQHDYVVILKPFLLWMLENGINTKLIEKKIHAIKAPAINNEVTHPDDILKPDEIVAMIKSCYTSRDRALISMHYEAATRIGEIGRMQWRDVSFDDYGARVLIHDQKTNKTRSARLTNAISGRYLAAWKDDYPGTPEGDAPIFLSERGGKLLTYYSLRKIIIVAARRAGLERRVNTHLFRKSRGTHLIEQGLPIANVVELMWANQSTKQIKTYIHLSPVEQDRVMLKHAGLLTDEENKKQERRLAGAMCTACHTQNSPTARYCAGCGKPLNEETNAKVISVTNMISQHPDIFQVVAEMLKEKG